MRLLKLTVFLCVFSFPFLVFGQPEKALNYRRFDKRLLHFGFMLGGNSAGFILDPKLNNFVNYGVKSVYMTPQAGGQVGIITSLRLFSPVFRLRFIPTLSFQERAITYIFPPKQATILNPKPKDEIVQERVGSTNLDFPLMIQFRTLRYNNFAAYALGGIQFSSDLQSQAKKTQSFNDPFIKIKRDDWQGQVGIGFELFAPYFKFGLEIKYSQGWKNVLIQDNTIISNPIMRLQNRVWWVSITFEG